MKLAEIFDVSGLATVVTGGASGIGYACAESMSDNGARVTLMDVDAALLESSAGALKARGGDVRSSPASAAAGYRMRTRRIFSRARVRCSASAVPGTFRGWHSFSRRAPRTT